MLHIWQKRYSIGRMIFEVAKDGVCPIPQGPVRKHRALVVALEEEHLFLAIQFNKFNSENFM